jgi:hypothetical protein
MADKPLWNKGDDDGLVTSPPDYYYPGSVIEYAPGYRILAGDEFRLRPKYDDANLEFSRRMTLTDPEKAFYEQGLLASAGYLNKNDVGALWTKDVADAYADAMSDANGQYMDLTDFLKLKSGQRAASSGGRGGGGGGGPTSYRNVSKSVSITSRPTAQALLKQTLAAELGREPTDAEVTRFVKALNKQERANPSVTVTTGSSKGGNSTSSSTTTPSKIDPGAEAEQFAETVNPSEARRYQTGELYDVISRMVG